MLDSNIDFDYEMYKNQLKFKLNTAINSISEISDLGNMVGNNLVKLYNQISKLNGKIDEIKYKEIVDVANLKADELNPLLKRLIKEVPNEIEYAIKLEAKEKQIMISKPTYFKIVKIDHIHSQKTMPFNIDEKETTVEEIMVFFENIKKLINQINDIGCNYNLCDYKVANVLNRIEIIIQSIKNNIELRCS